MTDVPSGTPVHYHCHVVMEWSHDPDKWQDLTRRTPDLVAWQPADVAEWVRDQLYEHQDEAEEAHGRHEWLTSALAAYGDETHLDSVRWEHLHRSLSHGHKNLQAWGLSFRKNLVLHMFCYADETCTRHQRPESKPYVAPANLTIGSN